MEDSSFFSNCLLLLFICDRPFEIIEEVFCRPGSTSWDISQVASCKGSFVPRVRQFRSYTRCWLGKLQSAYIGGHADGHRLHNQAGLVTDIFRIVANPWVWEDTDQYPRGRASELLHCGLTQYLPC
jgi:hypothetical protein